MKMADRMCLLRAGKFLCRDKKIFCFLLNKYLPFSLDISLTKEKY